MGILGFCRIYVLKTNWIDNKGEWFELNKTRKIKFNHIKIVIIQSYVMFDKEKRLDEIKLTHLTFLSYLFHRL